MQITSSSISGRQTRYIEQKDPRIEVSSSIFPKKKNNFRLLLYNYSNLDYIRFY